MLDETLFIIPNSLPIEELDCTQEFAGLTEKEKLYIHWMTRDDKHTTVKEIKKAAWNGSLITIIQTSPEAPIIYSLLHRIYRNEPIMVLKQKSLDVGVSENDFTAFLVYSVGFISNVGNYLGMGDRKFIPNIKPDTLEKIIKVSEAYIMYGEKVEKLWNLVKHSMFRLDHNTKSLGLSPNGQTTYFSSNCSKEDAVIVIEWLQFKRIEPNISRTFKTFENNVTVYTVRMASAKLGDSQGVTVPDEMYKGNVFRVTRGDYSPLLTLVNQDLRKAQEYAANSNVVEMLTHYINSFTEGNIDEHKEGTRFWIKDKESSVENYIGFMFTYRDPAGQRAAFETFIGISNKKTSQKFRELVNQAENFINTLSWGSAFEKDTYLKPDFTALDIVAYTGAILPIGVILPSYDEIRQDEGFKNFSFDNILAKRYKTDNTTPFLSDDDRELMQKYRLQALEVQVGLHELLGHGCGKLFRIDENGKYNFDADTVVNPIDGQPINKYYLPGETYDSKFMEISSAYEECRAESVGLYLSLNRDILKIFGHTDEEEMSNILYVNWLNLIWTGVALTLEVYDPDNEKWLQAHSQGRYVITRMLMENAPGLIDIQETDKDKNLLLTLNRDKIETVGKEAMKDFLVKLQVFKSCGDVENASKLWNHYSRVKDEENGQRWLAWRDIVLLHKKPRTQLVQPNTFIEDGKAVLKTYATDFQGFIQSWIERFPDEHIYKTLEELWEKDSMHF